MRCRGGIFSSAGGFPGVGDFPGGVVLPGAYSRAQRLRSVFPPCVAILSVLFPSAALAFNMWPIICISRVYSFAVFWRVSGGECFPVGDIEYVLYGVLPTFVLGF